MKKKTNKNLFKPNLTGEITRCLLIEPMTITQIYNNIKENENYYYLMTYDVANRMQQLVRNGNVSSEMIGRKKMWILTN